MTEVTRRHALMAAAAAGAAAATGLIALPMTEARGASEQPSGAALEAARDAARRVAPPPERLGGTEVHEAHVLLCRSWDRQVYLYVNERLKGFAPATDEGFAIAAACQATGRRAAVKLWGHAPEWAGAGRFEGALLALDRADLPGGAAVEA